MVTPTEQTSLPILKLCIFLVKYKPILGSACLPRQVNQPMEESQTDNGT